MKETRSSILIKLGAIFSFLFLIVGGFSLCIWNLESGNWDSFWLGIFVLLLGFFVTAALAPHIAKHDGDPDFEHWTIGKSIKGGLMFTFFASFLVFTAFSMYFWIEHGLYLIGIAGIGSLVLMIFIAIVVSIRYQTGVVRKALKDPNSVVLTGFVIHIEPHFTIQIARHYKVFFYRIYLDVGGRRSTTYLKARDPLLKDLGKDDVVNVKINLADPSYCAIIH